MRAWPVLILATACGASQANAPAVTTSVTPAAPPSSPKEEAKAAPAATTTTDPFMIGAHCQYEGTVGCTPDKTSLVTCTSGVMAQTSPCRGPLACSVQDFVPRCDTTMAEPGDRCGNDGASACTPDGKALVQCHDHAMVKTLSCGSCTIDGTNISCQ
jgi:hypothetical protein